MEEEEAARLGSRFSGTGPGTLHAGPGKTASGSYDSCHFQAPRRQAGLCGWVGVSHGTPSSRSEG